MRSLFLIILTSAILHLNASGIFTTNQNKTDDNTVVKIDSLINRCIQLRDISYDTSVNVGKQALELSKSINNESLLAQSYKAIGVSYFYQGVFDSSQYYYEKSLEKFKLIGDTLSVGKLIGNIGIIYRRTGKYDKALQQYLQAIEIYESVNYEKGLAGAYMNIGGVYHKLGNLDKALKFYIQSNKMYTKFKDYSSLSRNLTNIGVIKFEQNLIEESLNYQQKALELNAQSGMVQHKAIILMNIGECYEILKQPLKALEYYNQCEDIRLQLNDIWGIGKLYVKKAIVLFNLGQLKNSENYFKKAETFCKEQDLPEDLATTYHYYSKLFEKTNPEKALMYYKKYYVLTDSLDNSYRDEMVSELTAKFESEQKKKEFELLQQRTQIQNLELGQKNAWIIVLLVVMILGIVAVFVSLRINRLRADHKIMDLRQKVLLTQMNPHFLFNSLTAIQCFILDNKNDEANNYLSRLASLVRGILENSREEFVSLRTELKTLEDYIGLQKLRFENDIAYQFEVDASLDQDEIMVPPMLAQPFIENALIHGRLRNNPEANINVKVSKTDEGDSLRFSIRDNGIGINESKKQSTQNQHKSLATSIALDRVQIYNFKSSKKMNFEIVDMKTINENENGTRVTYSIPIHIYPN